MRLPSPLIYFSAMCILISRRPGIFMLMDMYKWTTSWKRPEVHYQAFLLIYFLVLRPTLSHNNHMEFYKQVFQILQIITFFIPQNKIPEVAYFPSNKHIHYSIMDDYHRLKCQILKVYLIKRNLGQYLRILNK